MKLTTNPPGYFDDREITMDNCFEPDEVMALISEYLENDLDAKQSIIEIVDKKERDEAFDRAMKVV